MEQTKYQEIELHRLCEYCKSYKSYTEFTWYTQRTVGSSPATSFVNHVTVLVRTWYNSPQEKVGSFKYSSLTEVEGNLQTRNMKYAVRMIKKFFYTFPLPSKRNWNYFYVCSDSLFAQNVLRSYRVYKRKTGQLSLKGSNWIENRKAEKRNNSWQMTKKLKVYLPLRKQE